MVFLFDFLARSLAQGILIVLIASFGMLGRLRMGPGEPVLMIVGPMANAAAVEAAAQKLGLRDPIPVQYFHWLGNVVRGDLGNSFSKGKAGQSSARADQPRDSEKQRGIDL